MLQTNFLSTPPVSLSLLELRAAIDVASLPGWLYSIRNQELENAGQGKSVFVLPGFGAGDTAMRPMRYFLKQHGYQAEPWGLGINKAGLDKPYDPEALPWDMSLPEPHRGEVGVPVLCDLMTNKVREFAEHKGEKVALVGWSLGGTVAREVARDLPDYVDQVITLGSPLIGGPKYTRAAQTMKKRGLDLDWIESEVERRNEHPLQCAASAIVSRTDGVVDWSASVNLKDTQTNYVVTDVSHLGMGINRSVLDLVLNELKQVPRSQI